jgi:hypothetical protein
MFGKRGAQVAHYIGDIGDGHGYLQILKPSWYTGRPGSKHVYKHHVILCEVLGITEIPKGFVIHHIDRDTHNNKLNTLALLAVSAHARLHRIEGLSK